MIEDVGPVDLSDPAVSAELIEAEVARIESQLIQLTRQAGTASQLDETLRELASLATRIRPYYARLSDALERRDLTYEDMAKLEGARKRVLWLYRRLRLEQIFFSKLRLERALRDTLYRQILEGYDEFSAMEATETRLRTLSDEALAHELQVESEPTETPVDGSPEGE